MEYRINLEIHTPYAVLLECCQESLQCEHLNHVKTRHEVNQAVSMVFALFQA